MKSQNACVKSQLSPVLGVQSVCRHVPCLCARPLFTNPAADPSLYMAAKELATLHWQRKTLDTASPAVQSSLDRCTEEDVPILKLLRQACPPGMHGFGCDTRWDVHDSFLPRPRRWVRQFNASRARAAMPDGVDCQRGFF